ncbi:MAG TPA: AraC family transcriptional regulator [Aldersonia sp.]
MTSSPEDFAVPPVDDDAFASATGIDALSEILHTVRLRGGTVIRCAPVTPFAVRVPAGNRVLHIVEHGTVHLQLTNPALTRTLHPGDLVLLARGDSHALHAGKDTRSRNLSHSDYYVDDDHADHPDRPRWVTGTFSVEDTVAGPLLSVLPPAIIVAANPDRDWLTLSLQLLLAEVTSPSPGSAVMISRILDLLFIHTLREWSARDTASPGWLTAALDPALAAALVAIHRDPRHRWTVEKLAEQAKLSRSSFAERFTRRLGQPPATYVTGYRLDHAAHLLRASTASVSTISRQVGYASEAAFSRAFQRRFGTPPLRWRKSDTPPPIHPARTDLHRPNAPR